MRLRASRRASALARAVRFDLAQATDRTRHAKEGLPLHRLMARTIVRRLPDHDARHQRPSQLTPAAEALRPS